MNKCSLSLLTLALLSASTSIYAKDKVDIYTDTNVAKLGADESALLKKHEGKFTRPAYQVPVKEYRKDCDKIGQNPIPEWIIDAKFGIYTHWGVYSIPGFADNTYVKYMYDKSNPRGV